MIIFNEQAKDVLYWLVGSINGKTWAHVNMILPWSLFGLLVAALFSRSVSILVLGENMAQGLGQRVPNPYFSRNIGDHFGRIFGCRRRPSGICGIDHSSYRQETGGRGLSKNHPFFCIIRRFTLSVRRYSRTFHRLSF